MANDSVIFIEEVHRNYERLGRESASENCLKLLSVPLNELPKRIFSAFVPPIFGHSSRKVYVDYTGPLIAAVLLGLTLELGKAEKDLKLSPLSPLLSYLLLTPFAVLLACRLSHSRLSTRQVLSLFGYSLYGPLFTLLTSLFFPSSSSSSHTLFFISLFIFSGLSCFRLVIIFLLTIPTPALRLLVCSLVSISQLLFTIFIHFIFIHNTFVYGKKLSQL